jgi:hypothetical protein
MYVCMCVYLLKQYTQPPALSAEKEKSEALIDSAIDGVQAGGNYT